MELFRSLVLKALIAGLVAGSLTTAVRHFTTTAAIVQAEVYESVGDHPAQATAASPAHSHGSDDTSPAAWEPADGAERTLYTTAAGLLTAVAFALLLAAAMALRGRAVSWRSGLIWGAAGCVTFVIAPGIGLPPELPGMAAAPVLVRQVWWIATAMATAGALSLMFLQRRPVLIAVGVVLLILPHAFGAPQPTVHTHNLPEGLAAQFVVVATLTNALFWLLLGTVLGMLGGPDEPSRAKAPAIA